eukprot:3688192-Prymnesium_polylepis.1
MMVNQVRNTEHGTRNTEHGQFWVLRGWNTEHGRCVGGGTQEHGTRGTHVRGRLWRGGKGPKSPGLLPALSGHGERIKRASM